MTGVHAGTRAECRKRAILFHLSLDDLSNSNKQFIKDRQETDSLLSK